MEIALWIPFSEDTFSPGRLPATKKTMSPKLPPEACDTGAIFTVPALRVMKVLKPPPSSGYPFILPFTLDWDD